VTTGAEERLLAALGDLGTREQSPFARVPGTHFGRFALIPALKGPTGADLESEGSFLLMCADFDPTPSEWTASLCEHAGAQVDGVLSNCEGFPGSHDPARVAAYFAAHNAAPGFTVAGYRRTTVEAVREALRLRLALRALAARGQAEGLEGEALREAWRQAAGG
jgi:hypothetical protein